MKKKTFLQCVVLAGWRILLHPASSSWPFPRRTMANVLGRRISGPFIRMWIVPAACIGPGGDRGGRSLPRKGSHNSGPRRVARDILPLGGETSIRFTGLRSPKWPAKSTSLSPESIQSLTVQGRTATSRLAWPRLVLVGGAGRLRIWQQSRS